MARQVSDIHRRFAVGVLGQYTGKEHRCLRDVLGWLAIGPESTRTGVMRIHTGAIAEDLGWPRGQVDAAIQRMHDDGVVVWSPEVRVISCAPCVEVVAITTEKHRASYLRQLETMPDCAAVQHARKVIQGVEISRQDGALNAPLNRALNAPLNGALHGDHREQGAGSRVQGAGSTPIGVVVPAAADTDRPAVGQTGQIAATQQQAPQAAILPLDDHTPAQDQKRQPQGQPDGKTAKRPRTVAEQKPTAEQTRAYFATQNAPASEADACLDYWQAQGFKRRAGPILDWEATCRTWIRNWRERGSQTQLGRYGKPAPRVAPVDDRTPEEVAANQARITAEIERCEREGRSYF